MVVNLKFRGGPKKAKLFCRLRRHRDYDEYCPVARLSMLLGAPVERWDRVLVESGSGVLINVSVQISDYPPDCCGGSSEELQKFGNGRKDLQVTCRSWGISRKDLQVSYRILGIVEKKCFFFFNEIFSSQKLMACFATLSPYSMSHELKKIDSR